MPEYRFPLLTINGRSAAVVLSIDSADAVEYVREVAGRLENPEGLWNPVGAAARDDFRRKFATGGNPRWAPLADRTKNERSKLIGKGTIPPKTPTGKIPRRLLQDGKFDEGTILIRTGRLRDSWVQKGARGHVEEVSGGGSEFFIGSQLTIQKELPPAADEKPYQIFTKKARKLRARGQTVTVLIPLARFHEEGTERMPARSVAVNQGSGDALLDETALTAIEQAALSWALGGKIG